jgi:hypothetical protein
LDYLSLAGYWVMLRQRPPHGMPTWTTIRCAALQRPLQNRFQQPSMASELKQSHLRDELTEAFTAVANAGDGAVGIYEEKTRPGPQEAHRAVSISGSVLARTISTYTLLGQFAYHEAIRKQGASYSRKERPEQHRAHLWRQCRGRFAGLGGWPVCWRKFTPLRHPHSFLASLSAFSSRNPNVIDLAEKLFPLALVESHRDLPPQRAALRWAR